ncbi:MAG: HAD family hydrolase [Treponema sp.]|jgi:hypothetical protein|nr:HAD family hydrolase [Treponema sp.]
MRKYKVIFFDWDGTAVTSRKSPADAAAQAIAPLLAAGVKLVVISGTSFKNIDNGKFAQRFQPEHRGNLYFGLDRGVNNYGFDTDGKLITIPGVTADRKDILVLHQVCFDFHIKLLKDYDLNTDIVFCRDDYCKIDIGSNIFRGDNQFFSSGELERVNINLAWHGYAGGVRGLVALSRSLGVERGLQLKVTTDAKYIELGFSTKSDNVDAILSHLESAAEDVSDCCFWGDEFLEMDDCVYGSDSFMITDKTKGFDFFDVSDAEGRRPAPVQRLGGGVECFLSFLRDQMLL